MTIEIERASGLPSDFGCLVTAADAEGFAFVSRLEREWAEAVQRFDGPGEFLLLAREGRRLVGVGGLTVDPFSDDPSVGRVRRLYVLPEHRGRRVGTELVRRIVAGARGRFHLLRLRSHDAGAFYETLGFQPSEDADATHRLPLSADRPGDREERTQDAASRQRRSNRTSK